MGCNRDGHQYERRHNGRTIFNHGVIKSFPVVFLLSISFSRSAGSIREARAKNRPCALLLRPVKDIAREPER